MSYSQQCLRCGHTFEGAVRDDVADAVITHARDAHSHTLERQIVLAHLEGVHPHEYEEGD